MRRTWRGLGRRSWRMAAPGRPMSSRASCWRSSASSRGRTCRPCRSRSILLPRWFPIHLSRMSYWARTVIVPLAGPGGAAAAGAQSARRAHPGAVRRGRARRRHQGAPPSAARLGAVLQRAGPRAEGGRAVVAEIAAPPRHRALRGLRDRAAERRGRAGRDLSRHGQRRDDVSTRWAIRRSIPTAPSPAGRSTSCWWSATTRPTASPASRRSGIPRWRATP